MDNYFNIQCQLKFEKKNRKLNIKNEIKYF